MATEWQRKTLGDLCAEGKATIQTGPFGSQLHSRDYASTGIPVITTSAIGLRRIDESQVVLITPEKAQELSRHAVRVGDILFARRGAQATGLSARVTSKEVGWIGGTGVIRVRFHSDEIDPEYISIFLTIPRMLDWIQFHALGSTMPNLNQSILRQLPLDLPAPGVQREIASILSAFDKKIDLNRRMNATLEETARALFKSWFVDFDPVRAKMEGRQPEGIDAETAALFPDRLVDSDLGLIPDGWRVGNLSETIEIIGGGTPKTSKAEYWGGNIPWFSVTDLPPAKNVFVIDTEKKDHAGGAGKFLDKDA